MATCFFYSQVYTDATWFFPRLDSLAFHTFNTLLGSPVILAFLFSFPLAMLHFVGRVGLEEGRIRMEFHRV